MVQITPEYVLSKVKIGMTREQVKEVMGEPHEWGGTSRKYRTPGIYKYGEIELHFEPWKTGKLWMVYREVGEDRTPDILLHVRDQKKEMTVEEALEECKKWRMTDEELEKLME